MEDKQMAQRRQKMSYKRSTIIESFAAWTLKVYNFQVLKKRFFFSGKWCFLKKKSRVSSIFILLLTLGFFSRIPTPNFGLDLRFLIHQFLMLFDHFRCLVEGFQVSFGVFLELLSLLLRAGVILVGAFGLPGLSVGSL